MSGIIVGSVEVEVLPGAQRFAATLRQQIVPDAARVGEEVGRAIGDPVMARVAQSIRDGLIAGAREASGQGGRSGEEYGGAFARTVKARIEEALRSLPTTQVGVATTEAEQKLKDLRAELESLRDSRIGVDISAEAALAKVDEIKGKLDELAGKSPDVQVRADTARAVAELDRVQADLDRLNGKTATIKVDVDDAAAKAALAADSGPSGGGGGSSGGGGLAGLAGGFLPALGVLGAPSATPLLGAAGGLTSGLAAAGLGTGAFGAVAIPQITAAVAAQTALTQAQQASAVNAPQYAAAQAAAADAVRTAQNGVANAAISAKDAQVNAATAVRTASEQAAAAGQALTTAEHAAAATRTADLQAIDNASRQAAATQVADQQAIVSAEQTLASAEYSERQAVDGLAAAQEALTAARATAQRQLEDLSQRQQDQALSARAGLLAIEQAQQNLVKVLAAPGSTQLQIDQARLAVDQANQSYKDLQTQIRRTNQDQAAAAKAGIAGNQGVESATKAVQTAQHGVASAAQGVGNAEQSLANARAKQQTDLAAGQRAVAAAQLKLADDTVKGQQAIALAQQHVADSQANLANAVRRQGEVQVTSANTVTNAQIALERAQANAVKAQGAASNATQQQQAAYDRLDPAQKTFLTGLKAVEAQYTAYAAALAPDVFSVVNQGLALAVPLLSALVPIVSSVTPAFRDLGVELAGAFNGPGFGDFVSFVQVEAPVIIRDLGGIVGGLGSTIGHLLEGFAPLANQIFGGLSDASLRLGRATDDLGSNPGFQHFLAVSGHDLPIIGGFLVTLVEDAGKLAFALEPLAAPTIAFAAGALKVIEAATPLVGLIARGLAPALTGLGGGLSYLAPLLGPVALGIGGLLIAEKAVAPLKAAAVAIVGVSTALRTGEAEKGASGLAKGIAALGAAGPVAAVAVAAVGAGLAVYALSAKASSDAQKKVNEQIGAVTAGETLNNADAYLAAGVALQGVGDAALRTANSIGQQLGLNTVSQSKKFLDFTAAGEAARAKAALITGSLTFLAQTTGLSRDAVLALATATGTDLTRGLETTAPKVNALSTAYGLNDTQLALLGQAYDQFHPRLKQQGDDVRGITLLFDAYQLKLADRQAADTFLQTLTASDKAIGVNKLGIQGNTAEVIGNRSALDQAITALRGQIDAMERAHDPQVAITAAYKDGYGKVLTLAQHTGLAGDKQAYLNTYLGPAPDLFKRIVSAADPATTSVRNYGDAVRTAGDKAQSLISAGDALAGLLATGLPGLSIPSQNPGSGGLPAGSFTGYTGRADGGFVPGPFGAPHPVLAHGGELILNPNQQQAITAIVGRAVGLAGPKTGALDTIVASFEALGAKVFGAINNGIANLGAGPSSAPGVGGSVSRWAGVVDAVLAALGQPLGLEAAVLRRISLESGGNPAAINLTDSNAIAGYPSQGLVQTIPQTFAAYAGPYASRGILDPFANIYAGMNYAIHDYGSIAAIDPLVKPGGYDNGGYLPPGISTVYNGTGKPEPVYTAEQDKAFRAAAAQGPAGPSQVQNIYANPGMDVIELAHIAAREVIWHGGHARPVKLP